MPFVALNACTQDYSLPSTYPLGVSGLGIDAPNIETPEERAQREKWRNKNFPNLNLPDISIINYPFYPRDMPAILRRVARAFKGIPKKPPIGKPGRYADPGLLFGLEGLGASAADCQRMHDAPLTGPGAVTYTEYANAGCLSFNPGSGTFVQPQLSIPAMPDTPFAQKVGAVAGAIQGALTPYLQLQAQTAQVRAAGQMQNKQIQDALRMQSGSDNTNLYLIGGGVLLAGLLVFALARRR